MSRRLLSSHGTHYIKRSSLGEGLPSLQTPGLLGVRIKDSLLLPCGPSRAREKSCLEKDSIPHGSVLRSAPLPPPPLRYLGCFITS